MITKSLAQFASPIITKAMETGGRSSTTVTTDYSGIGDALMKKAQLELNAATLKADVQMKTQAMNTEARLKMIDIEDARIDKELADRRASQDMGFMEKTMGVLQGAMSGAQTGGAVSGGNPWGIAIGAVAGGAMSADSAYSGDPGDEKREKMNRTNQTLGSIATIATTARGMYDKYKGNEVYKSGVEDLAKIQKEIGTLSGKEQEAKIAEYNEKSAAMQGEMGRYMGVQEAATAMEGIRKGQSAILSNDPETATKAKIAALGATMAADKELEEGSPTRLAKLNKYHGILNGLNQSLHGFDKEHQVSPQEFSHFAGSVDPNLGEFYSTNIMGMKGTSGGNTAASTSVRGTSQTIDPTTGTPIQQTNTSNPGMPVATGITGGVIRIPAGRGGVMDDGKPLQPAQAEMDMAKNAGPAAEAWNKMAQEDAADPGYVDEKPKKSLLEERMDEIRNSELNRGLKEERIREIAEYQLKKEGHKNIDAAPDDPKMTAKLDGMRKQSAELDQKIDAKFEELAPNLVDKDDKDAATNILIMKDNLNKQQALIDRLPADSQIKAKAAEFLLNGFAEGKSKDELLGSQFLLKGNVATVLGTGLLDSVRGKLGGVGKGSAKAVSELLSPDEIAAVEEYARNEIMAIQAMVKTGDKGVVNEGEVKLNRQVFFNHGMSKDRKQKAVNDVKENMLSKMSNRAKTAKPFREATVSKEKELIQYRGDVQIGKAYEEQAQREQARRESKAMQEEQEDLNGQGGFFRIQTR